MEQELSRNERNYHKDVEIIARNMTSIKYYTAGIFWIINIVFVIIPIIAAYKFYPYIKGFLEFMNTMSGF